MARLVAAIAGLLLGLPAAASIVTYTESTDDDSHIALGFPVPLPSDSGSAIAGFRSQTALQNHLTALAAQSSRLTRLNLGLSLNGQPIYAYRYGTAGQPAALQTAGLHAREWAAPEVLAGIIESLVAGDNNGQIEAFLGDNMSILLVPILNPDAFAATQNHPDQTRVKEDPSGSSSVPRDGRMRRKNLRDTDGVLSTGADTLFGVDLNRNIGPFWGQSTQSSASEDSIVYHGSAAASEPETRALINATTQLGGGELRLFIDTHSYGRVYYYNDTGTDHERLTAITHELGQLIRLPPARSYALEVEEPLHQGIGAADEYFAYVRAVPSYTLELEPGRAQQATEYGGRVVDHSGFLLPESEVPRVRDEAYQMARLAYYRQAGPAILQALSLLDLSDQQVALAGAWQDIDGNTRRLTMSTQTVLQAGTRYQLRLQFSKPMRLRNSQGAVTSYPGLAASTLPVISLQGERATQDIDATGDWQDHRYQADTYVVEFTLNANLGASAQLEVSLQDLSAMALDSEPASKVRWSDGHWSGWQNSVGKDGDVGGADQQMCLPLAAQACDASSGGGGNSNDGAGNGGGGLWDGFTSLLMLSYIVRRRRRAPA